MNTHDSEPALIDVKTAQKLIGLLGFALPLVLVGGYGLYTAPNIQILPSLSEYVYTPFEPFFIGILYALGTMFFAYRGYSKNSGPIPISDNALANIAGGSAIITATIKTSTCLEFVQETAPLGWLHMIAASTTLTCMALFCIFYFTQSASPVLNRQKILRNRIYKICGYSIVAGLLIGMVVLHGSDVACDPKSTTILWLEWMMIWAFSLAWCVKGELFSKKS